MHQHVLNRFISVGLAISLSSCMYKPTNYFCSGFYSIEKKSFDSLLQVQDFLYRDSICNFYRINYTAKGLLQQICDSVVHPNNYIGREDELSEEWKEYLKKIMSKGNIDLITFYPDSISIQFKNYRDPVNTPLIVMFRKPQNREGNNGVIWLDSRAYLIPMKEN